MRLLIIFLYLSFSLQGQKTQNQLFNVDSLKLLLETETEIKTRLEIITKLYSTLKFKDKEASKQYAIQLINEGQSLAPTEETLEAQIHLARFLQREGEVDSSSQMLLEVINNSNKIKYDNGLWRSYMILGNNLDIIGEPDEALKYFKLGYDFKYKLKDSVNSNQVKAIFSTNIANHLLEKDSLEECLEYFKEGSEAAYKLGNPNMVGVIYNNIGRVYNRMKRYDTALDYYKKSIHLRDSIGNKGGVLYATINLLGVYDNLGQYEQMKKEGEEALEIAKEFGEPSFIVGISNLLAIAEIRLDHPYEALKILKPLESIMEQKDINVDVLLDYNNSMYLTYFKIGNYQRAEYYLLECEKLIKKIGRVYHDKEFLERKINLDIKLKNTEALDSNFAKYNILYEEGLNEKFEKLGEIEAQYTNLENEKKVALLEKDKEVLTAVSSRNKLAAISAFLIALLSLFFFWRNKRQKEVIQSQNEKLENLNQTKDQIFSIIGHDLKKPAIAFRGITEKLRYLINSDDKERLLKYGDSIEKDALELNNLTDNLLSWALLQKDLVTFKEEKLDLANVSKEVVSLFSNVAKQKGIHLSSSIESISVNSDRNAIATVIRNLVDNAIKYSSEGDRVVISAEHTDGKVALLITDTGKGIAANKLPNLFLLSKEKSTKGTSGEKGTGLGLHIVKDLVEKCKGTINVDSVDQRGTTFRILLPLS